MASPPPPQLPPAIGCLRRLLCNDFLAFYVLLPKITFLWCIGRHQVCTSIFGSRSPLRPPPPSNRVGPFRYLHGFQPHTHTHTHRCWCLSVTQTPPPAHSSHAQAVHISLNPLSPAAILGSARHHSVGALFSPKAALFLRKRLPRILCLPALHSWFLGMLPSLTRGHVWNDKRSN